ncbi:AfsR/SARP family transcriptional regulator [Actinomadura madurae]|uniref:AfsR/SARP family transcriptional regulator n=1 Tax=Actinomadura madurae TaxID=1993 RepID=UPI000D9135FC|nr:winged helix-turn-helix domain-containing protein [Actinomadura madurae]SPT57138.1 Molybdopterin biosynthesis positive regulator [Actinomadura madurae]
MPDVTFSVLGSVEANVGDRAAALGGGRQRALLAALLLSAGRVVSVDRLVDELWGERPPSSARTQVHTLVHRVRRALGEAADSWGVRNLPLVLQVEGSPPTRVARFVDRLQLWLDGARIRSCGRGRADGLPEGAWQCRFQMGWTAGRPPCGGWRRARPSCPPSPALTGSTTSTVGRCPSARVRRCGSASVRSSSVSARPKRADLR